MNMLKSIFCLAGMSAFLNAALPCGAEEPKPEGKGGTAAPAETPAAPAGPLARVNYSDDSAGYSVKLPPGYVKLTDNETHEIFKGLSEFMGKEASERAQKRPPAWFKGPPDPKNSVLPPPMFAVGYSDLSEPIHADQLNAYKEKLEEEYKRQGNKYGEIDLKVVLVDGITSLQVEHDVFSPINNERSRVLRVAVPAKDKWFDLNFNFSSEQTDAVHESLKDVLNTFKIAEHQSANAPNQIKWERVLAYTVGFGLAGVLLSLILKKLGAVGSGGKASV